MSLEQEIDALNDQQRHTLGCIAMNEDGGHPQATLLALIRRGLIVRVDVKDGNCTIHHYETPIPVHIAWCEWCSKHFQEDNESPDSESVPVNPEIQAKVREILRKGKQ
jgi:hypothetical protein